MNSTLAGSRRLIVVVGPSGAGKDSVVSAWLAALPASRRPHRVRRTITRPADPHEDHEVADAAAFRRALEAGDFAFRWQAHGLDYGVRRSELAPLGEGRWVVMNGSRAHLPQLRAAAPQARVVAIDAPADLRRARLGARAREDAADRLARLARHVSASRPDLQLANDGELASAVAALDAWWRSLRADERGA